jgi:hypothetical protein
MAVTQGVSSKAGVVASGHAEKVFLKAWFLCSYDENLNIFLPGAQLTDNKLQAEVQAQNSAADQDTRSSVHENEDEEQDGEENESDEEEDSSSDIIHEPKSSTKEKQKPTENTKKSNTRDLVSHSIEFKIECLYGDPESLPDEAMHNLNDHHEINPDSPPPNSSRSVPLRGRNFACNRYYDPEGNELEISVFRISAASKDSGSRWHMNYALQVPHAAGETGEPIVYTRSISRASGKMSLGYAWDGQDQQFAADPCAIRFYVPEKAANDAKEDYFDTAFLDLTESQREFIMQDLEQKAKGRSKYKDTAQFFAVKPEVSRIGMRRPEKRLKTEGEAVDLKEGSAARPGVMPRLLGSARVRLLSEESDHARVFSLDGCDIKSLFGKAREFFGVKDPEKEISLVCRAPGLGSRRYIGEDCEDEFSLLCHDVRKLSIAESGSIEITVKPAAPERIQQSG